jgi:hypothetical protein
MIGNSHLVDLMNTHAAHIDNAGIYLRPWAIANLRENPVMLSLHSDGSIQNLSHKGFISLIQLTGVKSLRKKKIGVTLISIHLS